MKLGDKYAIVSNGFGLNAVDGPFYIVGLRQSRVALARDANPNPKAKRDWTAFGTGAVHRTGDRFPTSHAVPWTKEHEAIMLRASLVRIVENCYERARGKTDKKFEGLDNDQLRAVALALKGKS